MNQVEKLSKQSMSHLRGANISLYDFPANQIRFK